MIQRVSLLMWLMVGIAMIATRVGAAPNLHEYRLNNGLKLVVKEDHRAPVVLSQIWYGVGSANEHSGITGLSHVLEHMMFKGTADYPAESFSAIIAENGGRENAFTSRDYTGYYQLLEKSRLEISFKLESDRMRNLSLAEKDFDKELEVVKEERRLRTDDSPEALVYEQLFATAFNNGPYRNPVIGWMEDLNGMRIEDLRRWYNNWYAPNNAILVVVGDVESEQIYRLAQQYYGGIKARPSAVGKPRREPEQRGMRRVVVKAPAELPYLLMGYKAPVLGRAQSEWEPYALEVLTAILDGGRSSRFSKKLIREQELAASAGAGYSIYGRYDGLLIIDGVPAQGRTIEELEQALNAELDRLREQRVSASELKRVKAQVVAEEVYSQDSISRQASLIGRVHSIGLGAKVLDQYVDAIQSVTAEQIQAVARKFLVDDQKTVVILDPQPIHSPNDTVLADQASES